MAKLEISKKNCKSCGYCIKYCPKGVLAIGTGINKKGYQYVVVKDQEACIGCKLCATVCPDAAIEIYK